MKPTDERYKKILYKARMIFLFPATTIMNREERSGKEMRI